jgi:hypothetical protein
MFNPFKLSRINPELTFLKITNNGKIALAITSFANGFNQIESDNIGRLVDLTDGAIIFEFPYVTISNYFFNSEDSKLFYYDNQFIRQLDLVKFEITNLFELETKEYSVNTVILDKNIIHVCQDKLLHYTYDLTNGKKDLEVFNEFDYSVRDDIQKEFHSISGNTNKKLLMLKLIHGDNFKVKPLSKNSKDEYLILNFPKVFILKNGQFVYSNNINLLETDKITKEIKGKYFELETDGWYNKEIQLTDNNEIIFTVQKSLFILQLASEDGSFINNEIKVNQIDPFEINIPINDGFLFVELNETTGKLYYQIDIGMGCDFSNDNEIYVLDYYKHSLGIGEKHMQEEMLKQLEVIDKTLFNYYNSYINTEIVKNQPLESDKEKYLRVRSINNNNKLVFVKMQDSLFQILNNKIKDSFKIYKPDVSQVFVLSNYDQIIESWRLIFKNPYSGKDFSLIYPQPKSEAKLNLSNNYSDLAIEVKFYFNLISLAYEPLLVSITNTKSKTSNKFIIPFKDVSLLKNLYLTNNSFNDNYEPISYFDCRLERENITYDENIIRYFVNIGKPKYYFNYGVVDPLESNMRGVSIRNLDDLKFNFTFQNNFENCCPPISEIYKNNREDVNSEYLRFDEIPYFVNKTTASREMDFSSVYEINKTVKLCEIKGVYYIGKYNSVNNFFVNTGLDQDYNKGITNAYVDILDLKTKAKVKTFNIIELGSYKARIESVIWDATFSPNGKYFAIMCNNKTYLYETLNWSNLLILANTSGKLYWDCNSYYLGIGNDLIPLPLLPIR